MEIDQRVHRQNHFPVLVVEHNTGNQSLSSQRLHASIPQVELILATTAKEASSLLRTSFTRKKAVPRLVLLDPLLPTLTQGLALLIEIRASYPLLPVVILSRPGEQHLVNESYQLGAHSVIIKPTERAAWEQHFQALKDYWLDIVSLP